MPEKPSGRFVNMVQSSGNVTEKALDLAQDMATKAPISLRFVREAIYKGMDLTLDQDSGWKAISISCSTAPGTVCTA